MKHSSGFLKLVEEARSRVREVTVAEARERLASHPGAVLVDVREEGEWAAGHAHEAVALGRGILERDIESRFPDPGTELILYCGGGFRSALAAESLQKMGYTNVWSLAGGFRAMKEAEWPMTP
ncbi:MAG: sulfurtransferase [Verrucomicrobiae bacterium]|nr:sulfurtransferase [Verrucomicrobiae bacterium]